VRTTKRKASKSGRQYRNCFQGFIDIANTSGAVVKAMNEAFANLRNNLVQGLGKTPMAFMLA
jgi:hypothetical protein